ncbi:MAG: Crp/Fnr family transcriptional regulator [Bacteroidales bacterium]
MKTLTESDKEFVCDIQAPCFQKLNYQEVELVKNSKTQVMFRKGENLCKQGTFGSYVLFIIDGLVKQYVEGDQGRNYNLHLLQSGDFIGLSIVFSKKTFSYSTMALRETKAFLIEKEAINNLVQQNGQFAYDIIRRYIERGSNLYEILRNMTYKQMNGRLADALLYLGSEDFMGENVFASLSRKDVAEFAGISTESAVKLLKAFEKEGLIQLHEKEISLLRREALEEISKHG